MAQSMPQQLNKKSTSSHQLSDSYPLPLHMMQITSCPSVKCCFGCFLLHTYDHLQLLPLGPLRFRVNHF